MESKTPVVAKVRADPVHEAFVRMLKYARENHQENLEFEVRVGQFNNESEFLSGYTHDHVKLINRLMQRLQKNTTHDELKQTWHMSEKFVVMRCEYDKGIRKTCRPNFPEEYMMKKRVGKLDLMTNRQYHLRASLSKESPIDVQQPGYEYLKKSAPNSMRYISRASFLETVPYVGSHSNELPSIVFQYDISKVSESASTKKKCTESPCTYHCEIELKTKLIPIQDKNIENQHNSLIADLILARACALLGTSYLDSNQVLQPLPRAKLLLINKDG